eukprot:scaffold20320_cov68-Cyclotella_meneghiniana.AAC.4
MGRYRGGGRRKKWWMKKKSDKSSNHQGMTESDSLLVEKWLIDYRTKAYDVLFNHHQPPEHGHQPEQDKSYVIGSHLFPTLTTALCKQPYVDLPESLSPKERRHIHALCCSLDLYHCGAGSNTESKNGTARKRRIVVSIYANGFDYVSDLESQKDINSFPSRKCRPWYNRACVAMNCDVNRLNHTNIVQSAMDNSYARRISAILEEKQQIEIFTKYPEQSLRTSYRMDTGFRVQIDALDMGELESMDLSIVSTPKQCPWMLVDTVEKLEKCVNELMFGLDWNTANPSKDILLHELAFDLEMYNPSGGEKNTALRTCLIQLTSNAADKDYVIDPLAPDVWDAIPFYLGPLFSDSSIMKIGHGISGMDTTSLHRDFGILVINVFDTYEASAVMANKKKGGLGLAALCKHYGLPSWEEYAALKHTYQNSNWSKRPLQEDSLVYGRYDVRCLILLRKLLMRDLVRRDMIGSSFDDIQYWKKGMSDISSSTHNNSADMNSGSSVECSSNNLDSNLCSKPSSFQDFHDAIDDPIANDGSEDDFDDARDSDPPVKQFNHVLQATDLPPFHRLMQAMQVSNKRCLTLWTGSDNEHISKHPIKASWSDSHYKLYTKLVKWRDNVAEREGVETYEVCSLDFLVHVAYKQPLDRYEMRRFAYFLPEVLANESLPYYQELCELISASKVTPSHDMVVVFYQDHKKKRREVLMVTVTLVIGIAIIAFMRSARRK